MTEIISIMRIGEPDYQQQLIALIPFCSGEYMTERGKLIVEVGDVREKDQHQKVIFSGSAMPTIQVRGDSRFAKPPEFPRRVVNFPPSYKSEVVQQVGRKEELIFKRHNE